MIQSEVTQKKTPVAETNLHTIFHLWEQLRYSAVIQVEVWESVL